jgi:hypothetical protein
MAHNLVIAALSFTCKEKINKNSLLQFGKERKQDQDLKYQNFNI